MWRTGVDHVLLILQVIFCAGTKHASIDEQDVFAIYNAMWLVKNRAGLGVRMRGCEEVVGMWTAMGTGTTQLFGFEQ